MQVLKEIAKEIEKCKGCRKGKFGLLVPGEGNPKAKIMFIGEAPEKVFIFFNNNHSMLENGRKIFELLTKKILLKKESILLKTTSKAIATAKKIIQ